MRINVSLKAIIPFFMVFTLVTGCGGKKVKEDISESAPPAESATTADKQAEVVPDDNAITEGVTSENLDGTAGSAEKQGGQYASIAPGDELTKQAESNGQLYTIYFDYDKYAIRDIDKENLAKNAKWLSINPTVAVKIEGHADERGETEYNLALGDKRAKSVRKFLADSGIVNDRLSIISYGEEKPAANGHDEEAWAKNRRAEFMIGK